jgi:squalene-hopene cyclase-like protein
VKFINNAPWWLISAGLHAVFLLGAALIYVERLMAIDEIQITLTPREASVLPNFPVDTPRDTFTRKGLPSDNPEVRSANDEPVLFFPHAKKSDHNESASNEDDRRMKGDSTEFLSYTPGEAGGPRGRQRGLIPGVNDQIGVGFGGGGGGKYGFRTGGREDLRKDDAGRIADNAVMAALRWLARHQNDDGSWHASGFCKTCSGPGDAAFDTGVTSLSLLAFLGAGYTQISKDEIDGIRVADVVRKSLQWLTSHQDPEGCVGERGQKYMYNHAIASLALSEAYGMTLAPILKEPAQKSIDFLIAAQNPGKGWRYSATCNDNDTSVTGWAVMALKSAEISGLNFPPSAFQGALHWLTEATETNNYYMTGYNARGTGKVFVPGKNEQFDHHPSMSAVAVMSRIFIQKKRDPALTAVNLLAADLPAWKPGQVDFYYWYYASLALFQYDGPKGPFWSKWNEPMKNAIVPNQKTASSGCENGSWDPAADRWGFEGGRVYAAAINCLTLEVYYRYAHVFGGSAK